MTSVRSACCWKHNSVLQPTSLKVRGWAGVTTPNMCGTPMYTLIESSQTLEYLKDQMICFANELGKDDCHLGNVRLLQVSPRAYLRELENHAKGIGLPEGWVPATTYWYVDPEGILIGSSSVRHRLTEALRDAGGHISYVIRPAYRRKAHGTRLLALTLDKAWELGIKRALLTTNVDNVGSRKVIEKNGGVLIGESMSAIFNVMKARYWIDSM